MAAWQSADSPPKAASAQAVASDVAFCSLPVVHTCAFDTQLAYVSSVLRSAALHFEVSLHVPDLVSVTLLEPEVYLHSVLPAKKASLAVLRASHGVAPQPARVARASRAGKSVFKGDSSVVTVSGRPLVVRGANRG